MRKAPISGRNAVIRRELGDVQQFEEVERNASKAVVKAGT
jgi:hypothetical protein